MKIFLVKIISKIIPTCPVELSRQRRKESCDLIGQYILTLVYWPIKYHDSLGLWRESSTGHVGLILSEIKYDAFVINFEKGALLYKYSKKTFGRYFKNESKISRN